MPRTFALILLAAASLLAGCATVPPHGWRSGGRLTVLPRARWVNGDVVVDLDHQGRVFVNGGHVLTVDRAGRIFDPQNVPVALLTQDGHLLGTDDVMLGWIGAGEAILPGDEHSWLVLGDDGLLVTVNDDAERSAFGMWLGCGPLSSRITCTLVSHLVGAAVLRRRARERRHRMPIGFGLGVGIGVGIP